MRKILMLDLEGVLVASSTPIVRQQFYRDYGVRPYADEFLKACSRMFNNIYINAAAEREKAIWLMAFAFKRPGISCYSSKEPRLHGRVSGYENFLNSRIVHVEDNSISDYEIKRIRELGHIYVPVRGWLPAHAWGPDAELHKKEDRELLSVLVKLKNIV
jgi:hypothetical protein